MYVLFVVVYVEAAAETKAEEAKLDEQAEEKAHQASLQRKQELVDKWTEYVIAFASCAVHTRTCMPIHSQTLMYSM